MDILPSDLGTSASAARERLAAVSRQAALAGSSPTASPSGGAMAGAAREAVFADALLAAMHARFEEFKTVAAAR